MKLALGMVSIAACAALCACSSTGSNGSFEVDDAGNVIGPDGAVVSRDGGGGDGGTPGGTVRKGTITVAQTTTVASGQTYYSSYATAYFYQYDSSAVPTGSCTTTKVGVCDLVECTLGQTSTSDAGVVTPPNAGTLTVTGGRLTGAMTLTPTSTNGAYNVPTQQVRIFMPGDTMSVTASGGTVPAFSGKTVRAPGDLTVTAPVFDTQARTTASRQSALRVAWSGGTTGSVQVMISTSQTNVRSVSGTCIFPASAGSAQIPAEVMQKLDRANGTSIYGSIVISPFDETPFKTGDWDVGFRAQATGKTGLFTATD